MDGGTAVTAVPGVGGMRGDQEVSPAHVTLSLAGLQSCHASVVLKGKQGQPLSFPELRPVAEDIVRITWMSERHGTHIAEAKPRVKEFAVGFLPEFQDRLRIHPQVLSLEITELRSTDIGRYSAVVDTASKPSSPSTFSYLVVLGKCP